MFIVKRAIIINPQAMTKDTVTNFSKQIFKNKSDKTNHHKQH